MAGNIIRFVGRVLFLLCLCNLAIVYLIKRPSMVSSVEDETEKYITPANLELITKELSQNYLPRNYYHPENLNLAANYISSKFKEFNLDTQFQTYKIENESYSNVVSNFGPDTQEIIVVGAHYDAYSSYAGADDNASGVAGLLELGRALSKVNLTKRIVLVAYTCEEPPQYASSKMGSYIHANSIEGKDVEIMISLEMIGYFTRESRSQSYPMPLMKLFYPSTGHFIAVVGTLFSSKASRVKRAINEYTDIEAFSMNSPS